MENEYLYRKIDDQLLAWSKESKRKPLLVRGARQVGKSSAIKNLAQHFEYFVEVNFDQQKEVCTLFEKGISPQEICENLSLIYNIPIIPGKTLLFFDEIQACIAAISSLRYFYEKYPELRYKYRNREFWCRGYYVDTAGKNAKKIEEYIRHQLDEDKAGEQLTMGNF